MVSVFLSVDSSANLPPFLLFKGIYHFLNDNSHMNPNQFIVDTSFVTYIQPSGLVDLLGQGTAQLGLTGTLTFNRFRLTELSSAKLVCA